MRIVLTWGEVPQDLDGIVLKGTETLLDFNFANSQLENMFLEQDDTDGNGPEVIRITEVNEAGNNVKYTYYVKNYDGVPYEEDAKVVIYYGDNKTITINLADATGDTNSEYWEVFSFIGKPGMQQSDFTILNRLVATNPTHN